MKSRKVTQDPQITVTSRPEMTLSKRRKLDTETALIDLTAEDADDEDTQEPPKEAAENSEKQ